MVALRVYILYCVVRFSVWAVCSVVKVKGNYKYKLQYIQETVTKTKKRNRQRKIIWYNPPYNNNVQTNIGKNFLKIINKCFDKKNPLSKIFNKNTVKISYSTMPNMKNKIDAHNKKLLTKNTHNPINNKKCNCKTKSECPLEQNCLQKNIIYQAKVTRLDNNTTESYIGLCETDFKARYSNHKTSIKHNNKRNATELSKYIWKLKDQNINYNLNWTIIKQAQSYNNSTKRCNLCLTEKYYIINRPELATLNKKSEFISTCRHSRNYLLSHFLANKHKPIRRKEK